MFTLIESRHEIVEAQAALEETIHENFNRTVIRNIGYPGGNIQAAQLATDGQHWHFSPQFDGAERLLNWFGLLTEERSFDITLEVNTPCEGINRRVAGFFARNNENGGIYLMHSGKVGGGTRGVGQKAFLAWSNEELAEIRDSTGNVRHAIIVMPVQGRAATRSATRYVDIVARFKDEARGEIPELGEKIELLDNFFAEARGRRTGFRPMGIDYVSRHGDIVDALYRRRIADGLPRRGRIVKNIFIDMGVAVVDTLTEVFEVKTSRARTDIYTAIGQLMTHAPSSECRKVLILPKGGEFQNDIKNALKRLNIELLQFTINNDNSVTF